MALNTEAIFSFPVRVVLGNKRRDLSDHVFKRLRFLCFSFVLAIGYAGTLLIVDLQKSDKLAVALDLIVICAVPVLVMMIRWGNMYLAAFHSAIIVIASVISVGYFASTGNRTIFLTPIILIIAYFLLGRVGGSIWTGLILLANLISYQIDRLGIAPLPLSDQTLLFSSLSLCIVSILLFIYEGVNMSNEKRIAERDRRMAALNYQLSQDLASRHSLTVQLQSALNQLSVEKEGIEHQVELRTRQLQEEQARLQASIATLELGFIMTLQNGTVVNYNPALVRICEIDNQTPSYFMLNALEGKVGDSYNLKAAIAKCMEDRRPFEANNISIGPDKYIRILGSAIHLTGGSQALGVVLLVEDMTAAKLLERSENEFVAIASHELRTPLTIIKGNISLMKDMYHDKLDEDELKHLVASVEDATTRMIVIVNQFLTMARLEQKRVKINLEALDSEKIITTTLNSLKPLSDKKNLTLELKAVNDLPKIKADGSWFQEIISNLVNNAIKHTDHGGVTVEARYSKETGHVSFRIIDTGKGIPEKNQKLLFHKFQQATDNIFTRADSRSIGLGLYISKLLVEQMGGTIELENSTPDVGSIFTFTLPAT